MFQERHVIYFIFFTFIYFCLVIIIILSCFYIICQGVFGDQKSGIWKQNSQHGNFQKYVQKQISSETKRQVDRGAETDADAN